VFYSRLLCNNGEKELSIDSRTSDAVALALRFGCPIYIASEILDKAGITVTASETETAEQDDNDNLFDAGGSKYENYSEDELYKMIDEAVKTEDYERAASIRDEIEKRKKRKH